MSKEWEWTCSICGRIFHIHDKEVKPPKLLPTKEHDSSLKQVKYVKHIDKNNLCWYIEYAKNPKIGQIKDRYSIEEIY